MQPPSRVLAAFGAHEPPEPLPGGRGGTWRSGSVILKPVDTPRVVLEWMHESLRPLPPHDLRLCLPLTSSLGTVVVDEWTAFPFLAGDHPTGRWESRADVARSFAALLGALPRPRFANRGAGPWARADRFAWREESLRIAPPLDALTDALTQAWRPVAGEAGLVHGDIAGNVLVAPDLPPAVIDLTLYWRPTEYSVAILAVDATCFEGAPGALLEAIDPHPAFPQYLIRALLFRIATDSLRGIEHPDRYRDTVARVLRLSAPRSPM